MTEEKKKGVSWLMFIPPVIFVGLAVMFLWGMEPGRSKRVAVNTRRWDRTRASGRRI